MIPHSASFRFPAITCPSIHSRLPSGPNKSVPVYLRRLFVQGARSVMQHRDKQPAPLSNWLAQLIARTHQNVAIVALANKMLRMAWAVLCKNETYRIPALATAP